MLCYFNVPICNARTGDINTKYNTKYNFVGIGRLSDTLCRFAKLNHM